MFLASSAEKQTRIYDTECSNHHPSLQLSGKTNLAVVGWNGELYAQIY